jgi:DHA1 family tetracycline resistance protein-like MFS transporter
MLAPAVYNSALAWFTGPRAPFRFPGVVFVLAALSGGVAMSLLVASRRAESRAEKALN